MVHVDVVMICHDGSSAGIEAAEKLHKPFPFAWNQVAKEEAGVCYCGKEIKVVIRDGETCVTLGGSLQWLAVQNRPDLAFECNQLQKRVSDLRVRDLHRANRAVKDAIKHLLWDQTPKL